VKETERIAAAYRELEATAGTRYDLRNRGNQQVLEERRRLTKRLLARDGWIPIGDRRVLEVGSGTGAELAWMLELGASPSSLVGVDLLPDRVTAAKYAYPTLEFHATNAEHLDFADASHDLVMAVTVFSSILDGRMAANVAAEIYRVLRPGGALLWYDFRYDNPANRNVRGVRARRVHELFPRLEGKLYSLTVIPPLVRRLGAFATIAYPMLAAVPPLRSHLLGLLRKPA
jgi:ubiquinone/menaquinone biosynthesis C-methylase UbiE